LQQKTRYFGLWIVGFNGKAEIRRLFEKWAGQIGRFPDCGQFQPSGFESKNAPI
jgi:hypothetical protein